MRGFLEWTHLLHPDGIWKLHNAGNGMSVDASDGTQYQTGTANPYTQLWYVIVSDLINHTFTNILSDTVSFQLIGTPTIFSFHAEDKQGNIMILFIYNNYEALIRDII